MVLGIGFSPVGLKEELEGLTTMHWQEIDPGSILSMEEILTERVQVAETIKEVNIQGIDKKARVEKAVEDNK